METVSVRREFDTSADRICSIFEDVTTFFDVAGFEVERKGEYLELTKRVAVTDIELNIELCDDESAVLAYEQVEGPFKAMVTRYHVDSVSTGSTLTIETSFVPPTTGFGTFLNSAAIRRQRRAEIDAVASLLESTDCSAYPAGQDSAIGRGS